MFNGWNVWSLGILEANSNAAVAAAAAGLSNNLTAVSQAWEEALAQ